MKSTASKKNVKPYIRLFIFLFVLAVLSFFIHFNEEPLSLDQVQVQNTYDQEKARPGFRAPTFTLNNLQGKLETLETHKGKVVLINFWATWCAPCRVEMPSFETLYRKYHSEGLTILAVNLNKSDLGKVQQFVKDRQLSFPVLLDSEGVVEKLYPSFTIPATFVIDKAGYVVTQVDGAKNWESEETQEAIKYLLNKPLTG